MASCRSLSLLLLLCFLVCYSVLVLLSDVSSFSIHKFVKLEPELILGPGTWTKEGEVGGEDENGSDEEVKPKTATKISDDDERALSVFQTLEQRGIYSVKCDTESVNDSILCSTHELTKPSDEPIFSLHNEYTNKESSGDLIVSSEQEQSDAEPSDDHFTSSKQVHVDVEHSDSNTDQEIEAQELDQLVQDRIHRLQNPLNCSETKKLVCHQSYSCGFGCLVHHAAHCLIAGYATGRVVMFSKPPNWKYGEGGLEGVFRNISDTCREYDPDSTHLTPVVRRDSSHMVEELSPSWEEQRKQEREDYLPPAVPRDLFTRIQVTTGDPAAWWVGQFVRYLLRPRPELVKIYEKDENKMMSGVAGKKYRRKHKPLVGLHVRRGDKVEHEAGLVEVEEYMEQVKRWYRENHPDIKRFRVLVASDDPKVIEECRKKYPQHRFTQLFRMLREAEGGDRWNSHSLMDIIRVVHILTRTDFTVCTFSSNICRLVYELKLAREAKSTSSVYSLDKDWNFHLMQAVKMEVETSNVKKNMLVGDAVEYVGGNPGGKFRQVENLRTGRKVRFRKDHLRTRTLVFDAPDL